MPKPDGRTNSPLAPLHDGPVLGLAARPGLGAFEGRPRARTLSPPSESALLTRLRPLEPRQRDRQVRRSPAMARHRAQRALVPVSPVSLLTCWPRWAQYRLRERSGDRSATFPETWRAATYLADPRFSTLPLLLGHPHEVGVSLRSPCRGIPCTEDQPDGLTHVVVVLWGHTLTGPQPARDRSLDRLGKPPTDPVGHHARGVEALEPVLVHSVVFVVGDLGFAQRTWTWSQTR